ncbi:hypothetical protein [Clostridium sp. DJ247]|uniref:hypothetical protein n=1 Tax=Clostridium sp. DJ247 TaxID=2726188 RepID=UPI00162A9723|nr:hypothetical protein [Clostridium sp. DJ247]MBC2581899.1 hypothetical protein [Clostridium sp. DJ247]
MKYNNNEVTNPKDDKMDIDEQFVSNNSDDNILDNVFGDKMANMPKPLEEDNDYTRIPETYPNNETYTFDKTIPYRFEQYYTTEPVDSYRIGQPYISDTPTFYGAQQESYYPCSYFCPFGTVSSPTVSEIPGDIGEASDSLYRADGLLPLSLGLLGSSAYYRDYGAYNPYYNYNPYYSYSSPYGFYPW